MSFPNLRRLRYATGLWWACALLHGPVASAQMAVVDVRAIGQLVQQIRTMQQQLDTARGQLREAQSSYQAMTGCAKPRAAIRP